MAREGFVNYELPKPMADQLREILESEGAKHGMHSLNQFVQQIIASYTEAYFPDSFTKAMSYLKKKPVIKAKTTKSKRKQ